MNKAIRQVCIVGIAAALLMPLASWAAESEDIIKYRKAVMKAIGGHMGASSLIVRGKVPHKEQLKMHANALKTLSEDVPALFPEDSDFGETRTKAEVWEKWDDFKKAADDSKNSIDAFVKAVESGKSSEWAASFKKVGEGCKGCHKSFREKKDE